MTDLSINHMNKTNHMVKSFYRGIYPEVGFSGVETMELWDECQDCDFKTNIEVIQRRTLPATAERKNAS